MKTEKIILDGAEEEIVIELDDEYKDDMIHYENETNNDLDLPFDAIQELWEDTMIIDVDGSDYEQI